MRNEQGLFMTIEGEVGSGSGKGCPFAPRCPQAMPLCRSDMPPAFAAGGAGHEARCWLLEGKTP
jgi:oligopeptide/dipeptide ABC transporter ATP-binding protein